MNEVFVKADRTVAVDVYSVQQNTNHTKIYVPLLPSNLITRNVK